MKTTRRHRVVLVTAPDLDVARAIARGALEARAAACANIVPGLESHYWWQGKQEQAAELLVILKTTTARLPELERIVSGLHPYDTPEFVVLPLSGGSERYLAWLDASVAPAS